METRGDYPNRHVSFTGSMHITFKETDREHHESVNKLHIDSRWQAEFTGTCVTEDGGEKCLKLFKGISGLSKDPNNHPLEINPDEILSVVSHGGNIIWENVHKRI